MGRTHVSLGLGGLLAFIAGSWGCSGDDPARTQDETPQAGDTEFTSSVQSGSGVSDAVSGGGGSGGTGGGALPPSTPDVDDGAGDPTRLIAEADILQLSGDRLYALSRFRGLSIIDVSNPAALRLEGEYKAAAEPFEMYVQDGFVYAMFNGWYSYHCDDAGACSWQTESRMQALDTRDPSNIRVVADLEVPGNISDSRRVGDVLYLATEKNEWGYCWGCVSEADVTITSFDLSQPGQFSQIDQLVVPFVENPNDRVSGHSVMATDQRMYVSGNQITNPNFSYGPNVLQVVDISEPGGALALGDTVELVGPILSRWQMDEYEGVLRTITQSGGWGSDQPPILQTFTINSSNDIQRLTNMAVQLPRLREVLQSARFDGPRGYLITARQSDPLFTFDLSDPENPRQLGELEMPGVVYHMEPRGNRMYALGYDNANPEGALNVSLFDVENLAEPKLLSRVAFGGDWGSFAEGQNQIHKAFSILPDQGLILVPFSGGTYDQQDCSYDYGSGIQLIDFTDTTLTRRGLAPQLGEARRALVHRDSLFGIGDNSVQAFNIDNRDAPTALGQLDVARNVSTVRVLGDHLMRFGTEWSTPQTILDMIPLERADQAQPEAEIDLAALFGDDAWSCNGGSYWSGQVFTRGDFAYVPRTSYRYNSELGTSFQHMTVYVVDLSDRSAPRAVGSFSANAADNDYVTNIVQTDNALLIGRQSGDYYYRGETPRYFYDVFELSNPSAPTKASTFEVPASIAGYGWGYFGVASCMMDMGWGWYGSGNIQLADGDLVVSQHSEPVPGNTYRVKYFLDRIDVSDPYHPQMLPRVNIPGSVVHFNADTNELVTIDQQQTLEAATNWNDCASRGYFGYYETTPDKCRVLRRSINSLVIEGGKAVLASSVQLDRERRTTSIAVSDNRIFYTTSGFPETRYEDFFGSTSNQEPAPAPQLEPVTLETLTLRGGVLTRQPSVELRQLPKGSYNYSTLYARDERVFELYDNTVTVIDTVNPDAPTRLERELPMWGCGSLEVAGDTAYCAAGQRGVEVIDLSSMR